MTASTRPPAPIPAADVFALGPSFSWLRRDGEALLWIETRPAEGRSVLVRRDASGETVDLTPPGRSCSNSVGYASIPFCASPTGEILACDGDDQRLYSLTRGVALTEPSQDKAVRWGDFVVSGPHVYAVREWHHDEGPITNELVRVELDAPHAAVTLVADHDFVGAPRVSPAGDRIAWLTWDHPHMPWDETGLWVADLTPDGIGAPVRGPAGPGESGREPTWTPDGELLLVSDRSGWWNIYRGTETEPLVRMDADFCEPLWFLGTRSLDVFADGRLACRWTQAGVDHLGVLHPDGTLTEIETPYTHVDSLTVLGDDIAVLAAGPRHGLSVVVIDPAVGGTGTVLQQGRVMDPDLPLSEPEAVTFPTTRGDVAHGFYYPPVSTPDARTPDALPPLIVNCHGGPTSHVPPTLDLRQQYWTSRGYAYLELNYRGSTGYGRRYRDVLKGEWGVLDVDDTVAGAQHLVERGLVDGEKLVVRGLSAGGWLTLCAMTFRDVFAAGGSANGVADAYKMASDTHKFEAHYLDSLIGPLPEARALYDARSAITSADRITAPLILIQGADDEVVPADQAEVIAAVLEERGVPYEHHVYEGEGHLFAKAENLVHALEAETTFYDRVLGRSAT